MKKKTVTLFGGSGFLAKYIVSQLIKEGHKVNAICRNPHHNTELRLLGPIESLDIFKGNILQQSSIERYFEGVDVVINLVGILFETRAQNFFEVHAQGIKNIAELSKKYDIQQLIHFSSIGSNINGEAKYQKTKGEGENYLESIFPKANILRPSIVFGTKGFLPMQSNILKNLPFAATFSDNKFQPIDVRDIASVVSKIINNENIQGEIYELGGPDILDLKEIYPLILQALNIKRFIIPMPVNFAKLIAIASKPLPTPIITFDQIKMLNQDNVVTKNFKNTIQSLGITPISAAESINYHLG